MKIKRNELRLFLLLSRLSHSLLRKDVMIMGKFAAILGMILLIPVALVLVLLVCITLIGGYVGVVASIFWPVLLGIIGVIVAYKVIKHFIDK